MHVLWLIPCTCSQLWLWLFWKSRSRKNNNSPLISNRALSARILKSHNLSRVLCSWFRLAVKLEKNIKCHLYTFKSWLQFKYLLVWISMPTIVFVIVIYAALDISWLEKHNECLHEKNWRKRWPKLAGNKRMYNVFWLFFQLLCSIVSVKVVIISTSFKCMKEEWKIIDWYNFSHFSRQIHDKLPITNRFYSI